MFTTNNAGQAVLGSGYTALQGIAAAKTLGITAFWCEHEIDGRMQARCWSQGRRYWTDSYTWQAGSRRK